MHIRKIWFVFGSVLAAALGLTLFAPVQAGKTERYHSEVFIDSISRSVSGPLGPGQWFNTSIRCYGCHGPDPAGLANVDESGTDVNLFDHWAATMMAQSARDPLWRAKVRQEITINPGHAGALQDKCTSCHSPMGHYNAILNGAQHFTLNDMYSDSLGLDGVSCSSCHTMFTQGLGHTLGQSFSGAIPYDTTRKIYGPFTNPFMGPMELYEGYSPVYSPHMDESKACSPCHTLITASADLSGNPTGVDFIEQATYHEYLNSSFPANDIQCQTCHMPQLSDPIVIANNITSLQPRFPFNQHRFAGANFFMLNLMKNNRLPLGIPATEAQYDTAIAYTRIMLEERSVDLSLNLDSVTSDTLYYSVDLLNKAGHKFPSGYPARRAVLQFVVTGAGSADTLFKSGMFDSDYRVIGEDAAPSFEPHYQVINQNNQPQIYEMVMGDVNGDYTSVLERGMVMLKDNRLVPQGFSTQHNAYDTVMIVGSASSDPDFNHLGGIEGSGTDKVFYRVPRNGYAGPSEARARLYYQAVPPRFLDEMFSLSNAEIDTFRNMYNAADRSPFLMVEDLHSQVLVSFSEQSESKNSVFPSITLDGRILVSPARGTTGKSVQIFDAAGRLVLDESFTLSRWITIPQVQKGIYFVRLQTNVGTEVFRVVRK